MGEDWDRCEEGRGHTCVPLSEMVTCSVFFTCEVDRLEQSGVHRQLYDLGRVTTHPWASTQTFWVEVRINLTQRKWRTCAKGWSGALVHPQGPHF